MENYVKKSCFVLGMVYGSKITCYYLEILVFNWENNYRSIKLNTDELKKKLIRKKIPCSMQKKIWYMSKFKTK